MGWVLVKKGVGRPVKTSNGIVFLTGSFQEIMISSKGDMFSCFLSKESQCIDHSN